jgi:hypothetical protein
MAVQPYRKIRSSHFRTLAMDLAARYQIRALPAAPMAGLRTGLSLASQSQSPRSSLSLSLSHLLVWRVGYVWYDRIFALPLPHVVLSVSIWESVGIAGVSYRLSCPVTFRIAGHLSPKVMNGPILQRLWILIWGKIPGSQSLNIEEIFSSGMTLQPYRRTTSS